MQHLVCTEPSRGIAAVHKKSSAWRLTQSSKGRQRMDRSRDMPDWDNTYLFRNNAHRTRNRQNKSCVLTLHPTDFLAVNCTIYVKLISPSRRRLKEKRQTLSKVHNLRKRAEAPELSSPLPCFWGSCFLGTPSFHQKEGMHFPYTLALVCSALQT